MQHHAQVEAQDKAYRKIEKEAGLTRDQLVHCWHDNHGTRTCVFVHRDERVHGPSCPGISVMAD